MMRGLPLDNHVPGRMRSSPLSRPLVPVLLLSFCAVYFFNGGIQTTVSSYFNAAGQRDFQLPIHCPIQPAALQPPIAFPLTDPTSSSSRMTTKTDFIERLRGGGPHPHRDFYSFEDYLRATYPDVFSALKVENFATHALLFTWQGSDPALKPLVLMAHQDTVPVPLDTTSRWTHPPFDAHIDDDGWIWGRGVGDCKNLLIAELSAISELLKAGFEPTRSVHIAFGFDEEGGGVRSAAYISQRFLSLYGPDGLFMVVDEGGLIQPPSSSSSPLFVTPSLAEKGSVNVQLSVGVPGGHSSIPPAHTAIGILSALVTSLEASPPDVVLSKANPFAAYLMCRAEHDPTSLHPTLLRLLSHERTWPAAARWLSTHDLADAARLSTTQAVDIVAGGIKVNALPEEAHVVVNHRVSVEDSITGLEARYLTLLTPVAAKFGLTVVGFGEKIPSDTPRYLQLSHPGFGAEASPVTPDEGDAWNVFAATAKSLYPTAIVSPFLSTGGTDTRAYLPPTLNSSLTRAIYRFQAVREDQRANTHTIDERIHADAHISAIEFVWALVQNVDAWR
ncbi:Gly-Xaa carboxypeptidase [Mycena indigotica]|uniref:Gly-Xaa carboxypeptidase n=1 Tax=Mycena indigotica TaxID=2126181 RepID=A0A8H6SDS0_9AGAR|nr:Gly-Xaa carboxypeptidase [Mycena indigotica]KAF7296876.1 Gly-Xaa carboxypeptidase [Mycena indigotica]